MPVRPFLGFEAETADATRAAPAQQALRWVEMLSVELSSGLSPASRKRTARKSANCAAPFRGLVGERPRRRRGRYAGQHFGTASRGQRKRREAATRQSD